MSSKSTAETIEELKVKLEAAESRAMAAEETVRKAKDEMVAILTGSAGLEKDELERRLQSVTEAYENLQQESQKLQSAKGELQQNLEEWKRNFFQAELRAFQAESNLKGIISQFETLNPELQRLAYSDPLTGLANQNVLDRFLEATIRRVDEGKVSAAVFAIDLDRFSTVNDLVGWEGGNALLQQVAQRLQELFTDKVGFGRRGEDEFLAILTVPTGSGGPLGKTDAHQQSRPLAHQILEVLRKPFTLDGNPVYLSCSIGISSAPGDADTANDLLNHAQAALAQAKENGRDQFNYFQVKLQEKLEVKAAWEAELRAAVMQDRIRYLFRPVVNIERGVMVAADMVILWDHPLEGALYLQQFLDVAEKSGTSIPILHKAFDHACALTKKLRTVPVFFPVSLRMVRQAGLTENLLKRVTEKRARAEQLVAEISPQALASDPERSFQVAREMSHWGMGLAVPQVGTAEVSIWGLKTSPAKYLKLDAGLMHGVPLEENTTAVSKAVIGMARALGKELIVDGVTDKQKAHFLKAQACQLGVGDFFSQPLDIDGLAALKRQTWTL